MEIQLKLMHMRVADRACAFSVISNICQFFFGRTVIVFDELTAAVIVNDRVEDARMSVKEVLAAPAVGRYQSEAGEARARLRGEG